MDFSAILGCSFFLFLLLIVGAFYLQRLRWRRNKRLGMKHPGFCPSFSSLGNALERAQQLAQPQGRIAMLIDDEGKDEDEEEIAENGLTHLQHQLERIRSGDEIDRLTILLCFWRS